VAGSASAAASDSDTGFVRRFIGRTAPLRPPNLPAPVVPAPVGPAAPAGPAAAPSSGPTFSGAGHPVHQFDAVDAVVDAQLASAPSRGSVRATSGFAGPVVGGTDDPGTRPG
jgi:hypothetical protein